MVPGSCSVSLTMLESHLHDALPLLAAVWEPSTSTTDSRRKDLVTDSREHRKRQTWDHAGFLMLLFLATLFGGAILFLVRWIWTLIQTGG